MPLPPVLRKITTPVNTAYWATCLASHPDQAFAKYIVDGLSTGFRIGFTYTTQKCIPAKSNHPSANEHPDVIADSLRREVASGRLIGPLNPRQYPFVHISSLGVVPKKHSTNKWRLILDLSHPKGTSVNDGINRSLCSLTYMKVDDVVRHVLTLGKHCLLAKIDIEAAFRNIPVHPDDRHLLGMQWRDQLFVDTVLPFGLRSAPKIFNSVADALQWAAKHAGISYLEHFLDDFITAGAPLSGECQNNLSLLIDLCSKMGLPLAVDKQEGPSSCLVFLGIEVDTDKLELRLPRDKLLRLQATLRHWRDLKCCKKNNLQSLVGQLHDASIVIRSGRTFIRRLIDLIKASHHRSANSFIRLNMDARSDIAWWCQFIAHWNGLSMMHDLRRSSPDVFLTSDASGSWGCGAYCGNAWFQHRWCPENQDLHITYKELLPIVIAAAIWGEQWKNKSLSCRCDNEAVVHIINSGTSKDPSVMGLMRCLHFIVARFNILMSASHVAGSKNSIADALSRNNLPLFFNEHSQADPSPAPIPLVLLDLLIHTQPDWTSHAWNSMFNTIFSSHSQKAPYALMPQASADTPPFAHSLVSSNFPPQSPSSVDSLLTSASSNSSTRPSRAIYPVLDTSRSCSPTLIPSLRTCLDFNTSLEASNTTKRRKISNQGNDYQ